MDGAIGYIQRQARTTLNTLIDAARYAAWLVVAPALAFLLLTGAPKFWRSALRVLPRGHLQWRGEEYLQDVNSALAGYVHAQTSAGVIVGLVCVSGFALLGAPSAVSMGVAAGILELERIGTPITAMLIAITQAGDRALAVIAFLVAVRIVQDVTRLPASDSTRHAPVDAGRRPEPLDGCGAGRRQQRGLAISGGRISVSEPSALAGVRPSSGSCVPRRARW